MDFCADVGLGGSCLRIINLGFLDRLPVLDGLCRDSMVGLILFIGFILFGWCNTRIFRSCHVPGYDPQPYYNSYTHQVQSPLQYIIMTQITKKKTIKNHLGLLGQPSFKICYFNFNLPSIFCPHNPHLVDNDLVHIFLC